MGEVRAALPRVGCGYPCTRLGYYTKPALVGGLFVCRFLQTRRSQCPIRRSGLADDLRAFPLMVLEPVLYEWAMQENGPNSGG
jgi:hypothetical protein